MSVHGIVPNSLSLVSL